MIIFVKENKARLSKLYIDKDLSARGLAERNNIFFDQNWAKALFRVLGSKNKGLGGARDGSGNKKGIRFCGVCKKQLGSCICDN